MHESLLITARDTLLLAIPFGVVILAQFLRLDERIATTRPSKRAGRSFCGQDAVGDLILTDPDGRGFRNTRAAGPRAAR